MSQYAGLLRRNPDFARLWYAQAISLIGDWFNTIVLQALVAEYTDNSGIAISLFLMARLAAPLIVSPFGGVIVDRFDRKRLLVISDVARAIIVMLFLIVLIQGASALWLFYLLTVLQFGFSGLFEPGRNAFLPSLLPREDLVLANTLSSVTWSAMLAVGAIIGGVVAKVFGASIALVIDAITFLVSAWLILHITPRQDAEETDAASDSAPKAERTFRDGLRFVARRPGIAAALLVKFGQSIGNMDALMTVYATAMFFFINSDGTHDTTTPLSIMYAAFGVGAVLGPVLLNRLNDGSVRKMRRLIVVGFVWISLGWLGFGLSGTLALITLATMMRAMGGSATWTYSSVILQKTTPNEYLGRVFSLDMAGFQLASAVSIVITGVVVDAIGAENVRQITVGMGIASLVPLILWILIVPYLEQQEANQQAAFEAGVSVD